MSQMDDPYGMSTTKFVRGTFNIWHNIKIIFDIGFSMLAGSILMANLNQPPMKFYHGKILKFPDTLSSLILEVVPCPRNLGRLHFGCMYPFLHMFSFLCSETAIICLLWNRVYLRDFISNARHNFVVLATLFAPLIWVYSWLIFFSTPGENIIVEVWFLSIFCIALVAACRLVAFRSETSDLATLVITQSIVVAVLLLVRGVSSFFLPAIVASIVALLPILPARYIMRHPFDGVTVFSNRDSDKLICTVAAMKSLVLVVCMLFCGVCARFIVVPHLLRDGIE